MYKCFFQIHEDKDDVDLISLDETAYLQRLNAPVEVVLNERISVPGGAVIALIIQRRNLATKGRGMYMYMTVYVSYTTASIHQRKKYTLFSLT